MTKNIENIFFIKMQNLEKIMDISNTSRFYKLGYIILHHGIFSVIVHATGILLYARLSPALPPLTSFLKYFPMLEHSLISFITVLLGALICFYIAKTEK